MNAIQALNHETYAYYYKPMNKREHARSNQMFTSFNPRLVENNKTGYLRSCDKQSINLKNKRSGVTMSRVSKYFYAVLFIFAIVLFSGSVAYAEPKDQLAEDSKSAPEIRIMSAISKFTGTKQVALAFTVSSSSWLYSERIEIAVGSIGNSADTTAFISAGPLWRWSFLVPDTFFELGFSPTVLADTEFGPRDIGGHLHFSSSASIGKKLGKHQRSNIALRIQHISNGGLSSTNPGLDSVGLSFTVVL